MNAISTGKHNYGKSPIFYAITRGRQDIVRYLLNYNEGGSKVNVRIVNNKGQSVYSLAYSHDFSEDILSSIREREGDDLHQTNYAQCENNLQWLDYSVSHSDGCIYGDLDLRFLSRPVTSEDVIKDNIVVNSTTKESRRGNFALNNPSASGAHVKSGKKKRGDKKEQKKAEQIKQLSEDQHNDLEKIWTDVAYALQQNDSWELFSSLLAIVQNWEGTKVRLPWIADSASHLDFFIQLEKVSSELSSSNKTINTSIDFKSLLSDAVVLCGSGDRHATLTKRILSKAIEDPHSQTNEMIQRHDKNSLLRMQDERLARFWATIDESIKRRKPDEIYFSLMKPVILCDTAKRTNWTHDYSKQLNQVLKSNSLELTDTIMQQVLKKCTVSSNKYASLLKRILTRSSEVDSTNSAITHNDNIQRRAAPVKKNKHELPSDYHLFIKSLQKTSSCCGDLPTWNDLTRPHLPSKVKNCELSLSKAPLFVDSRIELSKLESKLREATSHSGSTGATIAEDDNIQFSQLVSFDSEFYTTDNGDTEVATIQFGLWDNGCCNAWVVDLLPNDEDYYSLTCNMLRWLFVESGSHIIGFAPRHDLHLLSTYLGEDILALSSSTIWDLQILAAYKMVEDAGSDIEKKKTMASVPGLKSICSYFSNELKLQNVKRNKQSWTLSKEEQCSDWSRRPLSPNQLEYAGLDAAVLLVLLSELLKRY